MLPRLSLSGGARHCDCRVYRVPPGRIAISDKCCNRVGESPLRYLQAHWSPAGGKSYVLYRECAGDQLLSRAGTSLRRRTPDTTHMTCHQRRGLGSRQCCGKRAGLRPKLSRRWRLPAAATLNQRAGRRVELPKPTASGKGAADVTTCLFSGHIAPASCMGFGKAAELRLAVGILSAYLVAPGENNAFRRVRAMGVGNRSQDHLWSLDAADRPAS